MSTTNDNLTLVIGSNGKTGRRVAERLTRAGQKIRAGSRRADPPFDWENSATWPPALHAESTGSLLSR